ncbi:GAF domain-containing protein [Sporolactobacillus shoreicorticis]|uniref:GAF domain-containing protein n=1 Tax=Sporolactobacillus shoreicorticis TaxID=1923877 RepID=A0ABW5RZG1_9BACL|nr:GAF domain-containing protein [Sporolactobacillus shoreicorticis]MCO7124876.1 GAF domain-containing protein [Sporolactobacillus shoreicorticis]
MNSVNITRIQVLESLIKDESNQIANLANASAWLNECLDTINWVGFYLIEDNELVLGPFQGKTACVRIAMGKGVCGTAAQEREILRIPDVHEFPGHIACDAASRSEIVIPLIKDGELLGVLDIDSPVCDRFSEDDQQFLEAYAETLVAYL